MATSYRTIKVYHALYDTGTLISETPESHEVSGTINITSYSIDVVDKIIGRGLPVVTTDGYVYPLYAIHNGKTYYYNKNTHSNGLTIKGTMLSYEIDNTWIIVYAAKASYGPGVPRPALLYTENEEVRLAVGPNPMELGVKYIIQRDDSITFDFFDINITTGAMSESFFTYGSTFSPTCSIEMMPTDLITQGEWFRVEFKIFGVWQNFGVFYVKEPPENTSEYVQLEGIGILEAIGGNYATDKTKSDLLTKDTIISLKGLVEDLWETYGVPLVLNDGVYLSSMENYYNNSSIVIPQGTKETEKSGTDAKGNPVKIASVTYAFNHDTIRSVLSKLSLAMYSNVVEQNGIISIVHNDRDDYGETEMFSEDDCVSEPIQRLDAYYSPFKVDVECQKLTWNSDYRTVFNMDDNVKVNVLNEKLIDTSKNIIYYPVEISSENGGYCDVQALTPSNWGNQPFAQYDLHTLATNLQLNKPFYYYPIEAEINGYSPFIYAGSCTLLKVNGVTRLVYVGNLNLSWSGGMFSMSISAPADIDIESVNAGSTASSSTSGGTSSSASGNVSIGLATSIQNATIFDDGAITGDKIAVNTIKANNIDVDDLFAEDITATNLTITGNSDIVGGKIGGFDISDSEIYSIKETGSASVALNKSETHISADGIDFDYSLESPYLPNASTHMSVNNSGFEFTGTQDLSKMSCSLSIQNGLALADKDNKIVVKFSPNLESYIKDLKLETFNGAIVSSTGLATQTQAGLMSAADKKKLDEGGGGGGTEEEITAEMVFEWYGDTSGLSSSDGVGIVDSMNYKSIVKSSGTKVTEVE